MTLLEMKRAFPMNAAAIMGGAYDENLQGYVAVEPGVARHLLKLRLNFRGKVDFHGFGSFHPLAATGLRFYRIYRIGIYGSYQEIFNISEGASLLAPTRGPVRRNPQITASPRTDGTIAAQGMKRLKTVPENAEAIAM